MRLINSITFEFEEFEGDDNIPPYAILSHRWEEEEVSYKDVERGVATFKKGWQKITKCCQLAERDGLEYVWIDTCCIDKSSSAELSEAINSMFKWYRNSKICYTYLFDVHATNSTWQEWVDHCSASDGRLDPMTSVRPSSLDLGLEFSAEFVRDFCSSVWFTRGWTLQELIASESLIFLGHYWQILGTKAFLHGLILHVTGISGRVLVHEASLTDIPVAERISWAANRHTTRVEDRAYSLMGLLGVNMVPLYGEGTGAFRRLLEVFSSRSNDQSILLSDAETLSAIAVDPQDYQFHQQKPTDDLTCKFRPFEASSLQRDVGLRELSEDSPLVMANVGVSAMLRLIPWYMDIYLCPLEVMKVTFDGTAQGRQGHIPCIFLHDRPFSKRFERARFQEKSILWLSESEYRDLVSRALGAVREFVSFEDFFGRQCVIAYTPHYHVRRRFYGIKFSFELTECWGYRIPQPSDVIARDIWCPIDSKVELPTGLNGLVAIFKAIDRSGKSLYMFTGFDKSFHPCYTEFSEAEFGEIFGARLSPGSDIDILNGWKFELATIRGVQGASTVTRDSRYWGHVVDIATGIPGLRLKIIRDDNYNYRFYNAVERR